MNVLQLTKNEIGYLFVITALLPIMGFFLGFYSASNSRPQTNETIEQTVVATVEPSQDQPSEPLSQFDIKVENNKNLSDRLAEESELILSEVRYDVQAGLFSKFQNAVKYQSTLNFRGLNTQVIIDPQQDSRLFYRVVLGSFDSKYRAIRYLIATEQSHGLDLYIKEINQHNNLKVAAL